MELVGDDEVRPGSNLANRGFFSNNSEIAKPGKGIARGNSLILIRSSNRTVSES